MESETYSEYKDSIIGMYEVPTIEDKLKIIIDSYVSPLICDNINNNSKTEDIENKQPLDIKSLHEIMNGKKLNDFLLLITNYDYILFYKKFIANEIKNKEVFNITARYLYDILEINQEIIEYFLTCVDMDLRDFVDLFDNIHKLIEDKKFELVSEILSKIIPMFTDLFGQNFQELIIEQSLKIIKEDYKLNETDCKYLLEGLKQFDYPGIVSSFIELLKKIKEELDVKLSKDQKNNDLRAMLENPSA